MNTNGIWQIVKVDFLEKIRKRSFMFLVLAAIFVALSINNQNFILMYDNYTSDFNSGNLSSTIAVIFTVLFLLIGFYITKGSVEKDRYMKMGDIIASTPLSKTTYVLGKWIGNVLTLQFVVLIIFLFSVFMQLMNSTKDFNLIQSVLPFLIIAVPAMLIVATLSILFDVISILKNVLGSILYFFIWLYYMGISVSSNNSWGDLSGLRSYWGCFGSSLKQVYPDVQYGTSFLFMYRDESIPFRWGGIQFSQSFVAEHFAIALIIISLCLCLSILFFDRFTENAKMPMFKLKVGKTTKIEQTGQITKTTLSRLSEKDVKLSFFTTLLASFNVLLKMIPLSLWGIEAILGISLFIIPSAEVKHILYSAIWLFPIFFWSKIGLFQSKYGMKDICLSTYYSSAKQLLSMFITSIFLTILLCFGTIAHAITNIDFFGVGIIVIGSIFVNSFAICVGALMKKTKLFELCYVFIWYYGLLDNRIYQLDFLAISSNSIVNHRPYLYFMFSIIFLGITIVFLTTDYYREPS